MVTAEKTQAAIGFRVRRGDDLRRFLMDGTT